MRQGTAAARPRSRPRRAATPTLLVAFLAGLCALEREALVAAVAAARESPREGGGGWPADAAATAAPSRVREPTD